MALRLNIACGDYDRTRPLLDGRVGIEGCDPEIAFLPAEEMFVRAFTTAEFDVTELSFSRFILNIADGSSAYIGIPVFLSRLFRHSAIYIRTDRGIREPRDLKGRLIGVRNYANTASLVARGLLHDEYGVTAREIRWCIGDVDLVERDRIELPDLPPGFDLQVAGRDQLLSEMLASGELDGLIDYQPPRCFIERHPAVGRLFADHESVERDYFARTRIFPIMHVLGIRRSLVEQEGWVAAALFRAFCKAKDVALADLWSPGALKILLPWISEEFSRTVTLMGEDFWPYGVKANYSAIDSLLRYSVDQGLSASRLRVEALFASSMLKT